MIRSNLISLVRNLALDRQGVVVDDDIVNIANDHIHTFGTMNMDRSTSYTPSAASLSFTSGRFSVVTTQFNIMDVIQASLESGSSGIDSAPLDIISVPELHLLRTQTPASGPPAYLAMERLKDTGTSGNPQGLLRFLVYPTPSSTAFISIHYRPVQLEYTAGGLSTENIDFSQVAEYYIVRQTAIDVANILRRPPSTIISITAQMNAAEAAAQGLIERNTQPGPPIEEPE